MSAEQLEIRVAEAFAKLKEDWARLVEVGKRAAASVPGAREEFLGADAKLRVQAAICSAAALDSSMGKIR